MDTLKKIFVIFVGLLFIPLTVYAESNQILITISDTMEEIDFDGKWSFSTEWKESSLNTYNDGTVILRTAHQGDFIYVLIEDLSDDTPTKKIDYAIVCIDGSNNKSSLPDDNDYCFMGVLGNKIGFTYNGYSPSQLNGNFRKIPNDPETIIIGSESDENNRYSKVIHPSYEFKIPIKLVERKNVYGFYFSTFDGNQHKLFQWPQSVNSDNPYHIPSPSTWGEIISPDKSIPEFNMPILLSIVALTSTIIIGKYSRFLNY